MAKQEVAIKQKTEVSTEVFGIGAEIDMADIIIPKVLIAQPTSKFLDEYDAVPGQLRSSIDGELLGDTKNAFEAIVVNYSKHYVIAEKGAGNKFVRTEPVTVANANLPWEFYEGNRELTRSMFYDFFCVRAGALTDLPYVVSLGRTNTSVAKKLLTKFQMLHMRKQSSASVTVLFKAKKAESDKGSFYNFVAEMGRETTPEELETAKVWFAQLRNVKAKIHGEEETGAPVAAAPTDLDDMPF